MLDTKTQIDLKESQKALGEVQAALMKVTETYQELSKAIALDHNFVSQQSIMGEFFAEISNNISDEIQSDLILNANPAAEDFLNDQRYEIGVQLKACFAEANRNLSELRIFSRRNRTLNDVTDSFQNMLIVEAGIKALHENFTILSMNKTLEINPLLKKYKAFLNTVARNKFQIATSLGIDSATIQMREELAEKDLRNSPHIAYIAPILKAA